MKTTSEKTKKFLLGLKKTHRLQAISAGPNRTTLLCFKEFIVQDCGENDFQLFYKADCLEEKTKIQAPTMIMQSDADKTLVADINKTLVSNELFPAGVFETILTLPPANRGRAASVAIRALNHRARPVLIIRYLLSHYSGTDPMPPLSGAWEKPVIEKEEKVQ